MNRRWPGLLLAFVLGSAGEALANPSGDDGAEFIDALRTEGLPVDVLESKLREARLKRIPPERTRAVVEQLAEAVRRAERVTSVTLPGGETEERHRTISAGAAALAAGMDDVGLARTLATAGDFDRAAYAAQALTSLVSRVDANTATRLVQAALQSNQLERALTLRPALEALESAGFSGAEAGDILARDVSAGRPPLEAATTHVRETRPARERNAQSGSDSSGQSSSGSNLNSNSNRERRPGRGNDFEPPGQSKGRGQGRNR